MEKYQKLSLTELKSLIAFKDTCRLQDSFSCSQLKNGIPRGVLTEISGSIGHGKTDFLLKFLKENIPWIDEVSIGHALVCDAIYLGFENTIQLYKRQLM